MVQGSDQSFSVSSAGQFRSNHRKQAWSCLKIEKVLFHLSINGFLPIVVINDAFCLVW